MTAADSDVAGDILDCDRIGVVRGNIFNPLLHIAVRRILCGGMCSSVHEQGEHRIETSGHFHGMFKFVSSGIVDVQDLPVDVITERGGSDNRGLRGKVGCSQDHRGITAAETDPGIFPWILFCGVIEYLGVGID